jgi:hypothetical protein
MELTAPALAGGCRKGGEAIMQRTEVSIEFIGGPFDGHRQTVFAPLHGEGGRLALPVNENVFRMLEGEVVGPARKTPTVAVYELHRDDLNHDEDCQYRFVGSRPAVEFGLENWKV